MSSMGLVEMEVHRHGLMMLASSTIITFIGLFATMAYAHWLGAEILGYYFLFLSYYNILGLLSDLGINNASLKRISEGFQQDAYFTLSLLLRLTLFTLVSILLVTFRDRFVDLNNAGLFWILIIAFGTVTLGSCLAVAIAAANRLGLMASMSILDNVTRIGVQFVGVLLGFKVFGLAGGVIAGLAVEIAIALKYIDFRLVWPRLEHIQHIRSLLHYSIWASLASYCVAVMENINVILIGYFITTSDVGIFGICWAFSFFGLFVSTALCNTLWVKVSRWSASGERETIALALSRACSYALLFAIPILVGGVLLGEDLLFYLYSASFTAGFGALVLLLFARTMQSVYQIFYTFLMAMDAARDAFFVVLGGSAVNFILAMVLIPMVGLAGAAAGTLVTAGVGLVLAYLILRRHTAVSLEGRAIMRYLGAAGIMAAVLIGGRLVLPIHTFWKPFLLVLVGAGIYFGILLLIDHRLREDARRTFLIRWKG